MSELDLDEVPAFQRAPGSSAMTTSWSLLKDRAKAAKQAAIAAAIDIDPATLSNALNGKAGISVPKFMELLSELNLKIVDTNAQVIDQADFDGLARTAATLLSRAPHLLLKG